MNKPNHNANRVVPGRGKHIVFNNTIFRVIKTDHIRKKFTVKMIPPAQNQVENLEPDKSPQKPEQNLKQYLDKTRSTPFIIIPRVLAQAMPELWQKTLQSLLEMYDQNWNLSITFNARTRTHSGKLDRTPDWVKNHGNPDKDHLTSLKTYYLMFPLARYIMNLMLDDAGIVKIEFSEKHLDNIARNLDLFIKENPEFEDDDMLETIAIGNPPEEWTKLKYYKELDNAIFDYLNHINKEILDKLNK